VALLVSLIALSAGTLLGVQHDFFEKFRNFLEESRDGVTYVATWFPALGGALAGIRETGDFAGSAALSLKTASALEGLKARLRRSEKNTFARRHWRCADRNGAGHDRRLDRLAVDLRTQTTDVTGVIGSETTPILRLVIAPLPAGAIAEPAG
jgi:hypothetical protein